MLHHVILFILRKIIHLVTFRFIIISFSCLFHLNVIIFLISILQLMITIFVDEFVILLCIQEDV